MYQRHQTRIIVLAALALAGIIGQGIHATIQAQSTQQKPASQQQQPAPPKPANNNDFPEDTSSVPVIPSNGSAIAAEADANTPPPALPSGDADPVRSPDDASSADTASTGDSSSSSSSSALAHMPDIADEPAPDTTQPHHAADDKPKKVPGIFNRGKTPEQAKQETSESDLDVGNYYLSTRNYQGALSRFQSALVLDPENPDVYWGLAETQRNLKDYVNAKANYQKLIDYDPTNKHAKEAKKLLKEPELANAQPAPTHP